MNLSRRDLVSLLGGAVAAKFMPVDSLQDPPVDTLTRPAPMHWREIHVMKHFAHIDLRKIHDELYPFAEKGDTVRLIVPCGVTVGPPEAGQACIDIGDWPEGVNIEIDMNGRFAVART